MASARLRPAHRLRQRRDFDRVFNQPTRIADRHFTVLVRANACDHPRLGLVVSKRVDKRACARNRLKRLIREGFRVRLEQLGAVDVVVIPRPQAAREPNPALIAALERLFRRVGQSARPGAPTP